MINSDSFLALGGHGEISVDVADDRARLIVWLAPSMARKFLDKGFWVEFCATAAGAPSLGWCHFTHAFDAFNRSAFALSDMRHSADAPESGWMWLVPPKRRPPPPPAVADQQPAAES